VEEYEADDDAGVAVAIFTGPRAEPRASRYAEQLRSRNGVIEQQFEDGSDR
jgi:hypothetical protein